tara:strand:- start:1096 stop:1362 length:267 start_codon:yes stop_codon:yes gene_type:complete
MKFFIVLLILLNGQQYPKVFTYQYINFPNIEVCNKFISQYKDKLKDSIELQFSKQNIHSSAMICMTQTEISNLTNSIEKKKWQEQKHI